MSRQAKPSLQRLITTVSRGQHIRKITDDDPGTAPTKSKPLKPPSGECHQRRITVKPVPAITTRLTYEQKRNLSNLARRREADLPFVEIEEVFLTIYSTEEIKALAVTEVNNTNPFGPGSVNDPQMGPTDDNSLCATCSRDVIECPGHPGYIQLAEAMIHPLLIRETIAVLNIVCNDCGGMLLTEDEIKERGIHHLTGPAAMSALEKASTGLSCRKKEEKGDKPCLKNPTYKPTKSRETNQITYKRTFEGVETENIRTPEEVLDIFNNISDEEAKLMGYMNGAHPKRLIMEVLMVIPPVARPASVVDGKYMTYPLTAMYIDIIRHVKALKNYLEGKKPEETTRRKGERKKTKVLTVQDLRKNLFDRIKHFINNTDGWYTGGGQPYKSLIDLIKGKEGLIRGGIMSKRVDYSSRTVLSPDPTLAFGQVSVPLWMAPILTPKVRVNRYNRDELQNLLEKGKITYITFNEKPADEDSPDAFLAGTRNQVTEKYRSNYTLRDGDTVERWIQNGDIIIFNRQPTLDKYSFMGYRVVLRDQKTFGLNLSVTTPHNAD